MPPQQQLTPERLKFFQDRIALITKGAQNLQRRGPANQSITSKGLAPVTPFALPQTPTSGASGLQGFFESFLKGQQANIAAQRTKVDEAQKATEARRAEFEKTALALGQVPTEQARLEEEAGIAGKAEKVTDYTNQLEAEQRALTKQIEAVRANPSGMLAGALESEVNRVQRDSLTKQADLALLQSAANRDLTTAQSIIDRKIDLITEPLKFKLEFDKFFYEENKDILSKEEQRLFQSISREDERVYDFAQSEYKSIHDTYLKAVEGGAPEAVLQNILRAQSGQEALGAAGEYIKKPEKPITPKVPTPFFKFSPSQKGRLIGVGMAPDTVDAIQEYISTYGFDDALKQSLGTNADLVGSILGGGGGGGGFNYEDF